MASTGDYARLTVPDQFFPHPGQYVTFRLQYSGSSNTIRGKYGTLKIYGYDVGGCTGIKITQRLDSAVGGQWYEDYEVDSGLLGISYPEWSPEIPTITISGEMKAVVEIGDERDGEGHVINSTFSSDEQLVNMIITSAPHVAEFIHTPYHATGSTYSVCLYCENVYNASNAITHRESMQSYRISVYDSNRNFLYDCGEEYDFDTNIQSNIWYNLYNLKDNTTYYIRGRIKSNGGTSFYTEYTPLTVHYSAIPAGSDNFKLVPQLGTIRMELDLENVAHTDVVFSRTVYNENNYLELVKIEGNDDTVIAIDKFPIPKKWYTYKAVVYNGNTIVQTYYQNIEYNNQYVTISDALGSYSAVGNITKHPINRNNRGTTVEAMDSKYPYYILNGSPDYDSGQVDGLFSTIDDDCKIETDNAAYADILRAWLNNGRAKLLTYYTGEAWIVTVNNIATTDPNNNDIFNTSFNWTAIADADRMSEYVRLGLVLNE